MIPKYNEMYREILDILNDEEPHLFKDIRELVADKLNLSEEEKMRN